MFFSFWLLIISSHSLMSSFQSCLHRTPELLAFGSQMHSWLLTSGQSSGRIWQICWLLPFAVFIWISGLHCLVPSHLSSYCFTVFLMFICFLIFPTCKHRDSSRLTLIPCVTSTGHMALRIPYLQLWLLLWTLHAYFLLAILSHPFISLIFNLFVLLQLVCASCSSALLFF